MNSLTDFLAKNWPLLVTVMVGPLLALIGVRMTLAHGRRQQLIQLRENFASTIRTEKREIYLEVLRAVRSSVRETLSMGQMGLEAQLTADLDGLLKASERFRELQPEIELVASPEVLDLAGRVYQANGACMDVLYRETEKRDPRPEHSQEQREKIWEEVRREIQAEFDRQEIWKLYQELRNQIREELGFMALDPSLIPSDREQDRLKQELRRLK
jgi:hypothetical protein